MIKFKFIRDNKWALASIILFLMMVIVILLNVLVSQSFSKIDMTDDQRYSLSAEAKQFLDDKVNNNDLISTIYFEVYFEGDFPSDLRNFKERIEEKLQNFKEYSNSRIEYKFINPQSDITKKRYNKTEALIYFGGPGQEYNRYMDTSRNNGLDKRDFILDNRYSAKGIAPIEAEFVDYNGDFKKFRFWPGAKVTITRSGGYSRTKYVQFLQSTIINNERQILNLDSLKNKINNAPDIELKLAKTINDLITNKKRIGLLQGHGESRIEELFVTRKLLNENYIIDTVTINGNYNKLKEYDGLIIANPWSQYMRGSKSVPNTFSDMDLMVIDQFVMNGGKLMVFMNSYWLDYGDLSVNGETNTFLKKTELEKLLAHYGIKIKGNVLIDGNCMDLKIPPKFSMGREVTQYPYLYSVVGSNTSHPITKNLDRISVEFASDLSFSKRDHLTYDSVLVSSNNSLAINLPHKIDVDIYKFFGTPMRLFENQPQTYLLGGIIQGKFKSYFANKPQYYSFTKNKESQYLKESKNKDNKIMVIGNGNFLINPVYPVQTRNKVEWRCPETYVNCLNTMMLGSFNNSKKIDNAHFIENIFDFMFEDKLGNNLALINLRNKKKLIQTKELDRNKIALNKTFYTIVNILIPVLLIVSIGVLSFFYRKKRFSKKFNDIVPK